MPNSSLWILCAGACWRYMPGRFGPWSTVDQRFHDWRDESTLSRVLERARYLAKAWATLPRDAVLLGDKGYGSDGLRR